MRMLSLASASSNMRSKVKLLLIGCPRRCWAPPNPINASPSRVKRCALPYEKEATVNLDEGLSRGPRKGLQTMGRDGKGSRIITMQPACLHLGILSSIRVRVHMHDHLRKYTIERRIEMDTISNYLPGPDNTHFFLRRPSFYSSLLEDLSLFLETGTLGAKCVFDLAECRVRYVQQIFIK